jgi:hypothetical protein
MVIAKASCTGNCKRLNSTDISVGIIGMRGNGASSPLNSTFKIVASMILFIIFFTGHLVTWSLATWSLGHLVTWSLSHMVINLPWGAHNNYAKFHYNRISGLLTHRGQTNKETKKERNKERRRKNR